MSADHASLEDRIRRLEDIEEIRNLRMKYHYCVNENKPEETASIWSEDAYVNFEGVAEATGRDKVVVMMGYLVGGLSFIKQFPANHMVTVEGDHAHGLCYLDARYAHGGKSIIAAAKYTEKYRRTSEGWKISESICTVYFTKPLEEGWAGDNSQLIKVQVPA